jgi:hypothetical protein
MSRFADFSIALLHVLKPPGTKLAWAKGGDVVRNCNRLVKNLHGDWLWLIGDDHLFDPDIVLRLLACEKDVVVPLCLKRSAPFDPVVYSGQDENGKYEYAELPEHGLHEIYASGQAGMLIRRHVLEAIDEPWFDRPENEGEDVRFCRKVREAGFKIHCDVDTQLGHIGLMHVWPQHGEDGWGIELNIGDGQLIPLKRIKAGPSLTPA